LNDYESTLRHAITNEFLDMCSVCIKDVGIDFKGRTDLKGLSEVYDDDTLDVQTVDIDQIEDRKVEKIVESDLLGVDNDDEMCYPNFKDTLE
jgi:hypothetical protein